MARSVGWKASQNAYTSRLARTLDTRTMSNSCGLKRSTAQFSSAAHSPLPLCCASSPDTHPNGPVPVMIKRRAPSSYNLCMAHGVKSFAMPPVLVSPLWSRALVVAVRSSLNLCEMRGGFGARRYSCAPDMPTVQCCEPVVAAVDLGGGVPCLCRVAAEPQLVMAGLNASHLLKLYTSCGGLQDGARLAAACEALLCVFFQEAAKKHHHLDLNTLRGHTDCITMLDFSSDACNLATDDPLLRINQLE
ncbi:protein transport protein sec31-like [Hordeum vulgare]|nr:protein transport protein sec31-like [Hordeum vulgare]